MVFSIRKRVITFALLLTVANSYAQETDVVTGNTERITVKWDGRERLSGGVAAVQNKSSARVKYLVKDDVAFFWINPGQHVNATDFAGLFFNNVPAYKHGVALWRYKPWNSWSKPLKLATASAMPEDDVQFYYWQYTDGVYGAAVPLSGSGFRTTLGSNGMQWGSKAVSYADNKQADSIPAMAIAFAKSPYELFERIYRDALQYMGKGENLRVKKKFPEPFNYIGWCTWNASDNGKLLNGDLLLKAAKSFSDSSFRIGWMLVDDGWFQSRDRALQSYRPSEKLFPGGFKPVINKLKKEYGIKYMGVWHTLNGLWNGIDPSSELGKHFAPSLFSWTQKVTPDKVDAPKRTYYFIKPDSDSLAAFYNNWYHYFKKQGFDFVKVDNQLSVEKMAVNNYPIFTLSDSMHKALYLAAGKYFNGAMINCMDMTAEAYLNFGVSAVARSVEDYFPYHEGEGYDLQQGNAAAHIVQAIYNSIYFGQMVYPDFDIFQSHNPNAVFHAIARAINCGPVYITDNIGEQDYRVLRPLVFADGRIIRSATPLLPTEDCLFQVQGARLFKASSMVHNAGLLGAWNAADTAVVEGSIRPGDVRNIQGDNFALYEHFTKTLKTAGRNEAFPVKLNRMGYRLYYVVPIERGFAALGLTDKYNAPATVRKQVWGKDKVSVTLYEGGTFRAYCRQPRLRVKVNDKILSRYSWANGQLIIPVAAQKNPVIEIFLSPE